VLALTVVQDFSVYAITVNNVCKRLSLLSVVLVGMVINGRLSSPRIGTNIFVCLYCYCPMSTQPGHLSVVRCNEYQRKLSLGHKQADRAMQ